jgi:preprotein translocase subunit SecD
VQRGLQGLLTAADSGKARADSTKADTAIAGGGAFSNLIQQGSIPGEYFVKTADASTITRFLADSAVRAALPPAKALHWGTDSSVIAGGWYRPLYVTDAKPIITGEYLTDARPNTSPLEGTLVQFKLTNVGGRRFRNETGKHIRITWPSCSTAA